ncbi:hypothetical protein SmJEL517_g02999 [Synchytrium microbalum]|uniref:Altered inheritance of mitochondria protein 24, mitochondrial n=1 Tax=Synchytrium microbalum TaxID=1806994 RepID=A0A507BYJ8_9FUNG|nr:uncharacterized protein SmJEL517_g02999 [Synchytrium microbalum]TPX34380.1 hypothetical protein SmJEL517_g02999 [Synchytrium microbalum]
MRTNAFRALSSAHRNCLALENIAIRRPYSTAQSTFTSTKPASTSTSDASSLNIVQDSDAASKWIHKSSTIPQLEIMNAGTGSILKVRLGPKMSVFTYPNSLIAMQPSVHIKNETRNGIFDAMASKIVAGFLVVSKFTTQNDAGEVLVAPRLPGDIFILNLDGAIDYHMRRGAFLASTAQVNLSSRATVEGVGTIAFSAFGGLNRVILASGESCIVNPDHLVAWSSTSSLNTPNILQTWYTYMRKLLGIVNPQLEFITIRGPADFFLSSRVEGGRMRREIEIGKVPPAEPTSTPTSTASVLTSKAAEPAIGSTAGESTAASTPSLSTQSKVEPKKST